MKLDIRTLGILLSLLISFSAMAVRPSPNLGTLEVIVTHDYVTSGVPLSKDFYPMDNVWKKRKYEHKNGNYTIEVFRTDNTLDFKSEIYGHCSKKFAKKEKRMCKTNTGYLVIIYFKKMSF